LPSALDMSWSSANRTHFIENFYFNCTNCTTKRMNYTNTDDYSQSAFGEGGYVFEFDRNFVNPDTNLTMFQLLSHPWNSEQ
jgi:hypothetical protein